jgi:hypothetical protein
MKRAICLIGLVALPLGAQADGFDYTFVEGGIVNTEVDAGAFDVDGDGFGIGGSFAVADNIHILASYTDEDYDLGIDGNTLSIGAGFNTALSTDLDLIAHISYVNAELEAGPFSVDEDGYSLGAGIRARTGDKVELEAGLDYVDLDESDTVLRVGGRYYFNDAFAVGASIADTDGGLSWTIGVRAEFGSR